ncbi:hypothetical protein CIG19_02705 [Enterobacterales bacterium CwR94]|nr:hypothetical protein CIG19_02705 [Enterobacterales bacterium CwR94]
MKNRFRHIIDYLLLAFANYKERRQHARFERRIKILNGKAKITLPKSFEKMPEEMIKIKYISNLRPSEAWYIPHERGKVSFAFRQTDTPMSDNQLDAAAEQIKQQLSVHSPTLSALTVNEKKMRRLEMITPDSTNAKGGILSIMQLSSLNGKLFIATFNTTLDLKYKYTEVGKNALASIRH